MQAESCRMATFCGGSLTILVREDHRSLINPQSCVGARFDLPQLIFSPGTQWEVQWDIAMLPAWQEQGVVQVEEVSLMCSVRSSLKN